MEEAYASRHKNRGATLLASTDTPTSPLALVADITLFAPARNRLLKNSPTAICALADALITVVVHDQPAAVESLKDLSESMLWTFGHCPPNNPCNSVAEKRMAASRIWMRPSVRYAAVSDLRSSVKIKQPVSRNPTRCQ